MKKQILTGITFIFTGLGSIYAKPVSTPNLAHSCAHYDIDSLAKRNEEIDNKIADFQQQQKQFQAQKNEFELEKRQFEIVQFHLNIERQRLAHDQDTERKAEMALSERQKSVISNEDELRRTQAAEHPVYPKINGRFGYYNSYGEN